MSLHRAIRLAGHDALMIPASDADELAGPPAAGDRALFIVGGDGTVHRSLDVARRHERALYHVPMGTENLFSREFGMTGDLDLAVRSLSRPRFRTIDLASCMHEGVAPTMFALMCSVGPDASVIRRLTARRTGPIRHASYIVPIAHELFDLHLPPLTIEADGGTLVAHEPGMVLVANSRQYAMRLDPAPMAEMSDGLLDLVFFPARSRVELLTHLLAARLRKTLEHPGVIHRRVREVRLTSPEAHTPYQLDGESGWTFPEATGLDLRLRVLPGAARVLLPARADR
jgi:diacylglycerol kinase family enzyme